MLINFLLFQLGWFSCVLGAANGLPWLGPLVTLAAVYWHLKCASIVRAELSLILVASLTGMIYDQTLLSLGLIAFAPSNWPANLLPVWMAALWLLFSTTLNVSLRWMRRRYLAASIFGAIGGPAAYWGAAELGAITWLQPIHLGISLAAGWAILLPALLWLAIRFDGYATEQAGMEFV